MKKLCMIVFNYYDIDSRVKRQAEFVADLGWEVDIIALKSRFSNLKKHENIKLYELLVAKQRGSFIRYLFQYSLFSMLAFIVVTYLFITRRYCAIQVHNLPDFLVFSALIPKILGCPVMLDMHEITPEFFIYKYNISQNNILIKILKFIEKLSIGFSNHVITVNESIRDLLISRGISPSKISTILDSADERIFVAHEKKKDTSNFILLYHGTLTKLYGIDIAIKAISLIPEEKRKSIELRIAGDGPEEENLKKLTSELNLNGAVKFLGNHPLNEIPELLNQCDAGICPTTDNELTKYSLSTKLLEYVYMGKPVIASRLLTYQKYFKDSSLLYFNPGDEKDLSEKILQLSSGEELRKTLSANALESYKDMNWKSVKQKYFDILTGL